MNIQFSILLPVRNGGAYVKECVKSILAQTYQNFNLIVLDNNSTDGTKEWITSLKCNKIIIYSSKNDLTIEENWGRAVDIPKNEFMTLIGHDDILYPNYLQTMNNLINEYPDASLYQTHFEYIDALGTTIRDCKPMPLRIDENLFSELFLNRNMDSMGTGYMMRSKDYNGLGGIPLHYPNLLFADFELWLNLTSINYQAVSKDKCFAFRIHQSTTNTSSNTSFLRAFELFINYLKLKKEKNTIKNVVEQNVAAYIQFYCQGLAYRLIKTPTKLRAKGKTVKTALAKCKALASTIIPNNNFNPSQKWSVKLALIIDSNFITRKLFLQVKKIFKKPILN